jgi:hypothetical protein
MAAYTHTTTRSFRVLIGLAVLWGTIGLSGAGSWAANDEHTRATLRDLEGVQVVVEGLGPDVERAGLTKQQLQTDVELRLRQAGIRVLTKEERVPGRPWLYVNVNVSVGASGLTAYNIHIGLMQNTHLEVNDSFAIVTTWDYDYLASAWVANMPTQVRTNLRDAVDTFINAYLSVHPRPLSSATPSSTSPRRNFVR